MLSRNTLYNFFCLHWASSSINLIVLLALDWTFDNFKSSKLNDLTRLFKWKIRKLLANLKAFAKTLYLISLMALSFACYSFSQNPLCGAKDKLIRVSLTESNGIFAISLASTRFLDVILVSILSSVSKYSENNLWQIFKTILETRFLLLLAPVLALITVFQPYKDPCKRLLKA